MSIVRACCRQRIPKEVTHAPWQIVGTQALEIDCRVPCTRRSIQATRALPSDKKHRVKFQTFERSKCLCSATICEPTAHLLVTRS